MKLKEGKFSEKNFDFDIVIVGSEGLLGSNLVTSLKKFKIFKIARKNSDLNLDLNSYKKLIPFFKNHRFKYLINCAGIVNLKLCKKNFKKIKKINSDLPNFLTQMSIKYNFKLIHISTDHFYKDKVFKLHNEREKIYSINNYSKSKKIAETYVKKNPKNLIIRTNFTGIKKNNNSTFIQWLYLNIMKKNLLTLFYDMYVSTLDAKYCSNIILKLMFSKASGIYNVASSDCISKKDFAILFAKKLNKKIQYIEISCKRTDIVRGKYLGLNIKKTEKKLNIKIINSKKVISNLAKEFQY